jgi:hypothetical protein
MSWKRASRSRRQLDQIMDTKAVVCHQDWLGKGALVPCSFAGGYLAGEVELVASLQGNPNSSCTLVARR